MDAIKGEFVMIMPTRTPYKKACLCSYQKNVLGKIIYNCSVTFKVEHGLVKILYGGF